MDSPCACGVAAAPQGSIGRKRWWKTFRCARAFPEKPAFADLLRIWPNPMKAGEVVAPDPQGFLEHAQILPFQMGVTML